MQPVNMQVAQEVEIETIIFLSRSQFAGIGQDDGEFDDEPDDKPKSIAKPNFTSTNTNAAVKHATNTDATTNMGNNYRKYQKCVSNI